MLAMPTDIYPRIGAQPMTDPRDYHHGYYNIADPEFTGTEDAPEQAPPVQRIEIKFDEMSSLLRLYYDMRLQQQRERMEQERYDSWRGGLVLGFILGACAAILLPLIYQFFSHWSTP